MLSSIDKKDEIECEVLIKKYISLGYDSKKIIERLKSVDEKLFFVFNSPLKFE